MVDYFVSAHVLEENIDKIPDHGIFINAGCQDCGFRLTKEFIRDSTDDIKKHLPILYNLNRSYDLYNVLERFKCEKIIDGRYHNIPLWFDGDFTVINTFIHHDYFISSILATPDRIMITTNELMIFDDDLLNKYFKKCGIFGENDTDSTIFNKIKISIHKSKARKRNEYRYLKIEFNKFDFIDSDYPYGSEKFAHRFDWALSILLDKMCLLIKDFKYTDDILDKVHSLRETLIAKKYLIKDFRINQSMFGYYDMFNDSEFFIVFTMNQMQKANMDEAALISDMFGILDDQVDSNTRAIFIDRSIFISNVLKKYVYDNYSDEDAYLTTLLEFVEKLQSYVDTLSEL